MFRSHSSDYTFSRRRIIALVFTVLFISAQAFGITHALEEGHEAHAECSTCQLSKHFQYLVTSDSYVPLLHSPAENEHRVSNASSFLDRSYARFHSRAPPQLTFS